MNERTITIVNPAAEDVTPELALAPRLASLRGARVGLIDNGKHMADGFLGALGERLRQEYGVAGIEHYRKTSPSIPLPPDVVARLVASCDAVVHGVAD